MNRSIRLVSTVSSLTMLISMVAAAPAHADAILPVVDSLVVDSLADGASDLDACFDEEPAAGTGCTLRSAIEYFNLTDGPGSITFTPSLAGGTIPLVGPTLLITAQTSILGPPERITLDGTGMPEERVIQIHHPAAAPVESGPHQAPASISDSVITVRNLEILAQTGGGIDARRTPPDAVSTAPSEGAANPDPVYPERDFILENVTISDGGSMLGGNLYVNDLHSLIRNVVLQDGSAASGGGMAAESGSMIIEGLTATGNEVVSDGAGIHVANTLLQADDLIVDGNTAQDHGGGVYLSNVDGFGLNPDDGNAPYPAELGIISISDNTAGSENPDGADGGGLWMGNDSRVLISAATNAAEGAALIDGNTAHGKGGDGLGTGYGGGIYVGIDMVLWMLDTELTNNDGHHGGGLYLGATIGAQIERSLIDGNTATEGGGIYNREGSAVLVDTDVTNNSTDGSPALDPEGLYAGNGGGIWALGQSLEFGPQQAPGDDTTGTTDPRSFGSGSVIMIGGSLSENTADDTTDDFEANGGGLWAELSDRVELYGVEISGNTTKDTGGGIWANGLGIDTPKAPPTNPDDVAESPMPFGGLYISRSNLSNNQALGLSEPIGPGTGYGGAIASYFTEILIEQSSIVGNFAEEEGGGIWTFGGPGTLGRLVNSTVSGNDSTWGGGLWVEGDSNDWENWYSTFATNTANVAPAMYVGVVIEEDPSILNVATVVADHEDEACDDGAGTGDFIVPADGPDPAGANVFEDEGEGASSCEGTPTPAPYGVLGPDQVVTDAGLLPLASDGQVAFHPLGATSPAIDVAGPPAGGLAPSNEANGVGDGFCSDGPEIIEDARLVVRPLDGDGDDALACDAGATEFRDLVSLTDTSDGAEPATAGSVTITRTGSSDAAAEVTLAVTGGTATSGTDFTIATTATIPAGESSVVVPVTVIDDPTEESVETVQVTLTGADIHDVAPPSVGTLNIADNDKPEPTETLAGKDRIETATEVANSQFGPGSKPIVLLARSDVYADALAASSLAGALDAVILLTRPTDLPDIVGTTITTLGSTEVIILGGTAAVGPQVVSELEGLGATTDRIGGINRFETAALIFERVQTILEGRDELPAGGLDVFITQGIHAEPHRGWPDPLSASFAAAAGIQPILLVTTDTMPSATSAVLSSGDVASATLVGGTAAISASVETAIRSLVAGGTRVAGKDRYETSAKMAQAYAGPLGLDARRTWLATGLNFADALVAGPAAARDGAVLLLVHGKNPDGGQAVQDFIQQTGTIKITFIGGTAAITDPVRAKIESL